MRDHAADPRDDDAGVALSDTGRTWRLGARLRTAPGIDAHLETQHRETGDRADRDHGWELRSAFRW